MENPSDKQQKLSELLKQRWSPRAFSDRAVSAENLRSLVEAVRWAPSSSNDQPWFFIVAQKENVEEFAKALECLVPGNQRWAKDAAVIIFAVARAKFENQDKPNRHGAYDLGQAVALLTVEATSLGLYVHQMAGILPEKIREVYAIPEGYDVLTRRSDWSLGGSRKATGGFAGTGENTEEAQSG